MEEMAASYVVGAYPLVNPACGFSYLTRQFQEVI
jgi:hypothetical protein